MLKNLIKSASLLLVLLPLIIGLLVAYLRYIEKRTLFYPSRDINISPDQVGLSFENINFNTSDKAKIHGWFVPAKEPKYTILFCHGNAGNISHRIEKIKFLNELGCNVFIFDYRGYGKSKGNPSEKGLYKDVRAAYAYLLKRGINAGQIIGYGESIGGAVIIDLAYNNKVGGLILESTFNNAKDMAKIAYPYIPYWLFSIRFDSLDKIKSINAPKLVIHSINDEIVPVELSKKLYHASLGPKSFVQIHGGHNSCFYESEQFLRKEISNFLDNL